MEILLQKGVVFFMFQSYIRTDLALELRDNISEEQRNRGVEIQEVHDKEHSVLQTHIRVINKEGEKLLGKPIGNYITIESELLCTDDEEIYEPVVTVLHDVLKNLIGKVNRLFVIGLGNRNITPDALGPKVVDHLYITRHLIHEGVVKRAIEIAALSPGVMAQTGIETGTIIKSLCEEIQPDVVICVDALAARDTKRLNTTIQVCDTGITPGAGVGNRRVTLSKETIGIPVIAIGVPTVISMSAIVMNCVDGIFENIPDKYVRNSEQKLITYLNDSSNESLFVTPKNIDEIVNRVSYTISESINRFLT